MSKARKKKDHIHIRVEPEQKEMIARASKLLGVDVSTFVLQSSLKAAWGELAKIEHISLSEKDSGLFFDALMNPPEPNQNLVIAYKKYQEEFDSN